MGMGRFVFFGFLGCFREFNRVQRELEFGFALALDAAASCLFVDQVIPPDLPRLQPCGL
jgi:hypothetical protein